MGWKKSKQMFNSSKGTTIATESSQIISTRQPDDIITRQSIVRNQIMIWLDANIDKSNEYYRNEIIQLHCLFEALSRVQSGHRQSYPKTTIKIFTDCDQCVDFLTKLKDEKVIMQVSDTLGVRILPLIHDLPQLDSVYVLCENMTSLQQWATVWPKVKSVDKQRVPVSKPLEKSARQCDQNSMSISFVPISDVSSNQSLDQLDQSFMYTQILKEILLEIEYNEQSIKELADYCRNKCTDNYGNPNSIDEFEREYHRHSPFHWYTSKYFIYSMLNQGLRTLEVDIIIKMGFFIGDLHRHIEQLHSNQSSNHSAKILTVYRGQGMSYLDFEKMKKSQGGLLSFNNFLSTSTDRDVSYAFADSNQSSPGMMGILFEMTIDPSISSAPFVFLDDVSYYKDSEKEVLFSMDTIFRIGEIEQIGGENDRLWQVKLTLTSDNDQQLSALTKRIREETQGGLTGWSRLGQLLIRLGEFDKAEQVYKILLDQTSDNVKQAYFHYQLGHIKNNQSDYAKAICYCEKSMAISEKTFPSDHPNLATTYVNIASVYHNMGEYSKVLLLYEKVLEIYHKTLPPNHSHLATSYANIGAVYCEIGEHSKALSYYEKALEILQTNLPENHPDLSSLRNNIATIYYNTGEYSKAVLFVEKTLEIAHKTLPSNHPLLASSYDNIGSMYEHLGEYSKALSSHEKALEIHQKSLTPNHVLLATSYRNIGGVYDSMGEYSKAFFFLEKALEICQETLSTNHPQLAISYANIGHVHAKTGNYQNALSLYEKALEIYQKTLPPNHPYLATSYISIGFVYDQMGEYSKALASHEKGIEIYQNTLPPNHAYLATSYSKVGQVYYNMHEYSKALSFFEQALEIEEKSLPPDHPNLGSTYNNIGLAYDVMGDYSKALSFHEKAIEIYQKALPPNHPSLATSYGNIGLVYYNMSEYSRALSFLERAAEIFEKTLPSNHPNLTGLYKRISQVYNEIGEYSKDISFSEDTVKDG